jgi:hypothetical protein
MKLAFALLVQRSLHQVRLDHSEAIGKHCELGESEDRLFAMAWDILLSSNFKRQALEKPYA